MAALELLMNQHRHAADLLERIRAASAHEKVRYMGDLAEALTVHAALEERYFYPFLRERGFSDMVDRALIQHADTRRLVAEMLSMKKSDPRLEDTCLSLDHAVRKHIELEEKEVFPRIRGFAEELNEVGRQMAEGLRRLKDEELLEFAEQQQLPAV
ncbi:MAG: hemerythrin domain-containing protein [Myxococcaceae bacterium]